MAAAPALTVQRLVRRYGGNAAVGGVDFEAESHRITALIGPNGAGKTTLFHCVAGIEPADAGRVTLAGADISRLAPHRRVRAGLAWTFQRIEVFPTMTVADNLRVGADRRRRPGPDLADLLERLGLDRVGDEQVARLPAGTLRLVELGRALATSPRVLLLDEPASGLDDAQTEAFARLLPRLALDGMAIVLVEHDMKLVAQIADRVYVMDRGRVVSHGTVDEVRGDPAIRALFSDGSLERPNL
jgi:branched-chain amino acid transport system ATP-binding protein